MGSTHVYICLRKTRFLEPWLKRGKRAASQTLGLPFYGEYMYGFPLEEHGSGAQVAMG